MTPEIPFWIEILFGFTTLLTVVWFYILNPSRSYAIIMGVWLALQAYLAIRMTYLDFEALPPKVMLFGLFPAILAIVLIFLTKAGRKYADGFSVRKLTFLHIIRVPVELVLAGLYHAGGVSVLMTYEGTNFDILSGLTAPIIAWVAFSHGIVKYKLLIIWNIIAILLLLNVVITAIFSFPTPFQLLAFDQPNISVLTYPYVWLPTVVVPLVFASHFIALRKLIRKNVT